MQRFWAIEVVPGKPQKVELELPLHITQVALDANAKSEKRTSLQCIVDDKKITLGACRLNGAEQFPLDTVLDEGLEVTFQAVGENTLHVVGYYILFDGDDDEDMGLEGMEEDEEGEEEEEEEVASPVPVKQTNAKKQVEKAPVEAQKKPEEQPNKKREAESSPSNGNAAKKAKTDAKPAQERAQTPPSKAAAQPQKKSTPAASPEKKQFGSGLVIEEIVVGNGAEATPGNKVSVKYIGKFTNGKTFDSSLVKPFSFKLGKGEVIKGWDEGVKGMREGGKRRLIVPAKLGYGGKRVGEIPANSTLVFDVELIKAF